MRRNFILHTSLVIRTSHQESCRSVLACLAMWALQFAILQKFPLDPLRETTGSGMVTKGQLAFVRLAIRQ